MLGEFRVATENSGRRIGIISAKNAGGMSPTGQYKAAAEAYTAAKTYTEQLADQLFPPAPAEETQASSGTVTAVSTTTISQNTETASSSQPVNKK